MYNYRDRWRCSTSQNWVFAVEVGRYWIQKSLWNMKRLHVNLKTRYKTFIALLFLLHICVWGGKKIGKNIMIIVFSYLRVQVFLSISPNIRAKKRKWEESEESKTGTKMDAEKLSSPVGNADLSEQEQGPSCSELRAYYQVRRDIGLAWINKLNKTQLSKWG